MDTAAIGRQIAAESALTDPLSAFDRALIGSDSVQVRIPLRDPEQVRQALKLLRQVTEECILLLERGGTKDRSILFDVRGRIRLAGQKINHYRRIRNL